MSSKSVIISLAVSALINLRPGFASDYKVFQKKKVSTEKSELLSKGLEFYPIKLNKGKDREGIPFENKLYRLINVKPILALDEFSLETVKQEHVGVAVELSDRESQVLNKMSRKYAGADLGIFYNGRLVSVTKMKSKKDSHENIVFSLDNAGQFENILNQIKLS